MRPFATALNTVVLVASLAGLAHAQGREPLAQPTAVPLELAVGLAAAGGLGGTGDPQILVGSVPEWAARRIPAPAGGTIVGSAFLGSIVVAVLTAPTSDSSLRFYERELLRAGWRSPPVPPVYGGGFRPAATSPAARAQRSISLCSDAHYAIVSLGRQQAATTTLLVRLMTPPGAGGSCQPSQMPPESYRSPFPTLYNPPAAELLGTGSCSIANRSGSSGTGARYRAPMSPEAILDHYGRQLQDSGWKSSGLAGVTVNRTWARPDSAGRPQSLTISITSSPADSTCFDLQMNVERSGRP